MSSYLILRKRLGKGRFSIPETPAIAIAYPWGASPQVFYAGDEQSALREEKKGTRIEWLIPHPTNK